MSARGELQLQLDEADAEIKTLHTEAAAALATHAQATGTLFRLCLTVSNCCLRAAILQSSVVERNAQIAELGAQLALAKEAEAAVAQKNGRPPSLVVVWHSFTCIFFFTLLANYFWDDVLF